jgi:hypothetical protein
MEQNWEPGRILEVSGSYWQACALHAGVKLDIFTLIGGSWRSEIEVASAVGADPRATGMLLNALAAMGLLRKQDGRFACAPAASASLDRNSGQYLGHILLHHHHLMESWAHLDRAVRLGHPLPEPSAYSEEEWRESFLLGMFNLASRVAPALVRQVDLHGRRRLLDLGGGPGTYAIHFCLQNPGLEAVVYDLPTSRIFAEGTIARFGLENRIAFVEGDYLRDPVPGRFEVAWLSHVLHGEGPDGCARILERAAAALEPGGLILIHEFILADDQAGPPFPALFSLNMLLNTEAGQAYSQSQLTGMLEAVGVRDIRRLALDLPGESGVLAGKVGGT